MLLRSAMSALEKSRALIDRAAMPFAQIIEDADFVALVEQQFRANASDVTRAADHENLHARENAPISERMSKSSQHLLVPCVRALFLQRENHAATSAIARTRREDLQALLF